MRHLISSVFKFHALPTIRKTDVARLLTDKRLTSHHGPYTLPGGGHRRLKNGGNVEWVLGAPHRALET